jgi:glyoxylase-like metal-dependent hydrolase (beta-lactamase superfamily II)
MEGVLKLIKDDIIRTTIEEDYDLLICKTCGTQYSIKDWNELNPKNTCKPCLDPRQYVPEQGQQWSKASEWLISSSSTNEKQFRFELIEEKNDARLIRIITKNTNVGIGETPFIILTKYGIVIWDCCALYNSNLFESIKKISKDYQLSIVGIAISHPHFYTSSLTWAKALQTKIFISHLDKQWFQRINEGLAKDLVVFFDSETYNLLPGITIIRCGGHFDGSCVLHWDRQKAGTPATIIQAASKDKLPFTGAVFCSDTFGPGMDRKTITFMWSYPNMIPLPPKDVLQIWHSMQPFQFDEIIGAWPGKYVDKDARANLLRSAKLFVKMEGYDTNNFDWKE